ncbi:hypothetical protein [Kitasatospora sp. NPDC085879]|uniref:hypothetical protein n=1 Tax=Kitasatospora sp. NPDC085879 TaxID=3154769 RepID=UPI0034188A99
MTKAQTAGGGLPKQLKMALGFIALQILLNLFAGVLLIALGNDEADHGGDGAGTLQLLGWFTALIALALVAGAVGTPKGLSWARPTVLAVEGLGVIGSLFTLFSGNVTSLAGIAIAVVIIRAYVSPEAKAHFA